MNRLFTSLCWLIAMVFLIGSGTSAYGDSSLVDRFIDVCDSVEKLYNKSDTLDIQMAKYDRLQRKSEALSKETQGIQINLNNMTHKLGAVSNQLWKSGAVKGSGVKADQTRRQLNAESDHLNREIEKSTVLLQEKRQAQKDLDQQIRETLDIIDAIAGDDPQAFREHLLSEQEKLTEEGRSLLKAMTDEEKRFAWHALGVHEATIEEMLAQDKTEQGVEFMNRLSTILNKPAGEMGSPAIPDILRHSQADGATGKPRIVAGSSIRENITDDKSKPLGPDAKIGFSVDTEEVEFEGYIYEELINPERAIVAIAELGKERELRGVEAVSFLVQRGEFYYLAGVGLVSKHRQPSPVNKESSDTLKSLGPDAKIGFSVDTEDVEFEGYIYQELINPDRAIVVISEQGKEREIRGGEAVTFLVRQGEFYYLAGVGLVSKHRQPAGGEKEAIAKAVSPLSKAGAANTLSCDELVKQYDQECELMHGKAVQAYCAKFDYSGCALDVPSCFSPYFPRQVFAGKACTDEKIRNCLNGAYGGFVGCVRGCNAQAASSGAAGLAGCIQGCGNTIKAGIESCKGTHKP